MKKIRILALSGSLRKCSVNTALLNAIRQLAPEHIEVRLFNHLGELPLFNPDLENEPNQALAALQQELSMADGVFIASPEYAHGISGVLKNALDWLVGSESFPNMPVALFNTSPRASHAQAALREVIKTMSGNVIEESSISVPLLGCGLNHEGIVSHTEISAALNRAVHVFVSAIHQTRMAS
ncbi:NADPH-dependent FMN reductase [Iodobacter sp. LRB]|uniref:NADPH-dependent FMN reductase n=1 Tax=unclassified Iodobacter TaxID=235634 RepID=UPI0015D4C7A7|nr:NADPH-dependent FMN reductase [Iodobacter sp. BJB302]